MGSDQRQQVELGELWDALTARCSPAVLCAPKTWGDLAGGDTAPVPDRRVLAYLGRNVAGRPWDDHLVLLAMVLTAQRLDPSTILATLRALHAGWARLFPALGIATMDQWEPRDHLRRYLLRQILPDDTDSQRQNVAERYCAAVGRLSRWLAALPPTEQGTYRPYALPVVDKRELADVGHDAALVQAQQEKRKAETEVIVHRLREIVAEAHMRYNRFSRLRAAYLQAIERVREGHDTLPCLFHLLEGGDPKAGRSATERLTFRLWDRRSFALAHAESYSRGHMRAVRNRHRSCAAPLTDVFVEYLGAESLREDIPAAGLWFAELLAHDVLGDRSRKGPSPEVVERQAWLTAAGYADYLVPFRASLPELGNWNRDDGQYMQRAQTRAQGQLIPIAGFYHAFTFGLAALELFASSGMRINELLQIRTTLGECLVSIRLGAASTPPGQAPETHYALRLIPKGERRDQPANFWIGKETLRTLARIGVMLEGHYGLRAQQGLPIVPFTRQDDRHHRFGDKPYLFQLQRRHLAPDDINACMRLLLHGMAFATTDGQSVVIKAHLLRHAFATWAVQQEKQPLDVVAALLHQRDVTVTEYYARATARQQAAAAEDLLARFDTFIDLDRLGPRSPTHLQRMLEDARTTRGTLLRVIGGVCTLEGPCVAKFACMGCPAKAVDPAQRLQVEERGRWCLRQADWARRERYVGEALTYEQEARTCAVEVREMDGIDAYRKDEAHEPDVQFPA